MIEVVQGDLAGLRASAVLRPVSAEWDAVSAAGRRVEIAAGPALLEHCAKLGELPVGSAVLTPPGNLPVDFVIHGIVRSLDEPVSESSVYRALQNALRRCEEWGVETLATPPLGTGAGNLDPEDSASIMIPLLLDHMQHAKYPARVMIVVESEYEDDVFRREISRYDLPILPAFPDPTSGNEDA